ncbi:MAG: methyltransferase domain-containing protein, partial [Candidatus Hydrogenedentes bacterium]|nr:methyltransferase domain-containing protein [Candidatus Hydrogenedentota bacterium]
CGKGLLLESLKARGKRVLGIDPISDATGIEVLRLPIERTQLEDESWDTVISIQT